MDIKNCTECEIKYTKNNVYERANGKAVRCKECEQKMFERLEQETSSHLALYAMCLSTDTPFLPLILPDVKEFLGVDNKWIYYNDLLREKGYFRIEGKVLTFADGATNILKIFGKNLSEETTAKYIEFEMKKQKNTQGTQEQREVWGTNWNYTTAEYNDLDRRYEARAAVFKGVTINPQMESTLRKVCIYDLESEKAIQEGDIQKAKSLNDMSDKLLASEQLRKKDEKPVETMRIDALVKALEDKGCMEEGKFVTLDTLLENVMKNFVKKRKYGYSLDVADQIILDNYNNIRADSDLSMVTVLPEGTELVDDYEEFEETETETEKEAKKFLGLPPVSHSGNLGDE